ncbi:FAD-dependent monooxygenase [Actinomadura barringtoniae]|uniref:FAD-dependent monooxygenase n=1 Tax=Actinomadura barringtoniae TaxID=1427535 RepID=A0A939P6J0_9ACTN|nr:FAD-dependent monooxygenase [Actinomadura barringtoniae]MBO2445817.1 FAD-dependent monooxygenase [Actinomadura barringtoniae]
MRVLISGASIAGLTLAHWLARHGFTPTVVERAPGLREGGQGVDVRDQAIEVVERMGLMADVRARAADVGAMTFVNGAGRDQARIDIDAIKAKNATGEVEIMRGDLVGLLHAATDVEYLFGDSIQALDQDAEGVTVTFESGLERRFELVVGADGLHSNVRRLAFGPESRFLQHRDHYFAFANADASLGVDRQMTVHNLPGKMAGVYRSGNHAQAKAYFIYRSPEVDYDHRDLEQQRAMLREQFADVSSWHTQGLLASALADPAMYFDSLSQVRMESWSSGRVVLVGDAAYCASPASGAGAELALTGAYRLAIELAMAGGDHEAAFRRYEEGQRELVTRKQQIGPNVRLMVPRTRLGMRVRNLVARLPLAGMERIMAPRKVTPLPTYVSNSKTQFSDDEKRV